jgi:hypothetical protein
MNRFRRTTIIASLLLIAAVSLAVRETVDGHRKKVARDAVFSLGGQVGSLPSPIPFLGSELRYEFHRTTFKPGDLQRLIPLGVLARRHWVDIMFKDTNLTASDISSLRAILPGCHPFRVVNGERMIDQ